MTDELEITSGGMICIDSSEVRAIGDRLDSVRIRLQGVRDELWRAHGMALHLTRFVVVGGIAECARRVDALAGQAERAASGVSAMADTYEYAELMAKQQMLDAVDPAQAALLQARIDELLAGDPTLDDRLIMLRSAWQKDWAEGTGEQKWDHYARFLLPFTFSAGSGIAGLTLGAFGNGMTFASLLRLGAALPHDLKTGRPAPGAQLTGEAPPVTVTPVSRSQVVPVSGIQDSLQRIPQDDEGQIVVEKYTFADGSEKFVAYIDGTRSMGVTGGDEPWDMGSNVEMYLDQKTSASYAATMQALKDAGMMPGDELSLVTYSQGGLIGTYIAMGSEYRVTEWIAAGNPVDPVLEADQMYVDMRHRGDPVSNLSAGGDPGGTGSPQSFTVRASVEPGSPIEQHKREHYLDTARQVDQSGDPRVRALQEEYFATMQQAVSVERVGFQAKRA